LPDSVFTQTPLYMFLWHCEQTSLPRNVLDCGAGGRRPPLALFRAHGYRTAGLELDPDSLAQAEEYCAREGVTLGIQRGDMRSIPFEDESFSFVYSYNAVFFLTKEDMRRAVSEMCRVLRPSGLCYINVMSVDDPDDEPFSETSYLAKALGNPRFSKHGDTEADEYFDSCDILRKEKRIIWKQQGDGILSQVYVDYVVRKRDRLPK
jgi:ubiquinone/menaquinone biosynthesis C-methylase UbiE